MLNTKTMKTTMIKSLLVVVALSFTACNNNSKKYSDNSETDQTDQTERIVEDANEAKTNGYNRGYEDGWSDGYGWKEHGVSYNDKNSYQTEDAIRAYKSGYENGYNEGYNKGEAKYKSDYVDTYNERYEEREAQKEAEKERLNDWHNWEDEDVDGLYIYLDGVDDDDVAENIAREDYDGEYIRYGWDYYAKISYTWGEYKITLGRRINAKFYKVKESDIYIHFKWLPDVSTGDEGILDWSGKFSSFYKKPDNL